MTQKRKSQKKGVSAFDKIMSHQQLFEKIKLIAGFLLVSFSLYLLLAFISFIFSGGDDQSLFDVKSGDFILRPGIQARNWAGKGGAWLADVFINRWFGLASFIFVFPFGIIGLRMWGRKPVPLFKTLAFSFFLILWTSITLGYFFISSYEDSFIYLGGVYGFYLSNWMISFFGSIGTFLVLSLCFIAFLIFTGQKMSIWLNNLLDSAKRIKEGNNGNEELDSDAVIPASVAVPAEEEKRFTKLITDNDTIEADFDPDQDEIANDEDDVDFAAELEDLDADNNDLEVLVADKVPEDEDYRPNLPEYNPWLDLSSYKFPSLDLMDDHSTDSADVTNEELISNKNRIVETLRNYKIEITKIKATIGPTVTLYEIVPAPGVRIAKIKNLEDDIALSLSALGIRIIAPIPGKGTIGIEVPNRNPEVVSMRSVIASRKFQEMGAELPIALGKTISNETFTVDLAKMPHVLVAGATGQGKSVGLNAIIASLLYKKHPSELKFVMIDPKKVELSLYAALEKHFLAKLPDEDEAIITDIHRVKATLNSVNVEMDQRYDLLKKALARNIKEYNKKFIDRKLNPEKGHRYLPYIVVVIDEFADLIMTAGKDIEMPIARIAQLARAVGIHMIIATQRPSTNIITGVIKANFPTRVAFKVASMVDSRTILDTPGANQLIGKGDMLISFGSNLTRVQCAFVDTPEVERICEFISEQRGYDSAFLLPEFIDDNTNGGEINGSDPSNRDELFDEAARLVVMGQTGSTSSIQRKFSIGYNRAGRIMDQLEAAGIVGSSEGSKARKVLVQSEYDLERLLSNN
ncbi:MAG: DNA translocase FtsK [Bacteroidota bacterium]|nr:DNA translocase FtsK [Bacteroidota bacterium]